MKSALSALALAAALAAGPAMADSFTKGTISLGFGLATVNPKDDNGKLAGLKADIGNSTRPTFTAEYFVYDNVGVELLAAVPFEHTVKLSGLGKVATTKQLPPVISIQYHFPTAGRVNPFVGAGINYTTFYDEKGKGALAGTKVRIDDSWGVALHAGVDWKVTDNGWLRTDLRWINIESDVKVNGSKVGTAKVDPWVVGISYVVTF